MVSIFTRMYHVVNALTNGFAELERSSFNESGFTKRHWVQHADDLKLGRLIGIFCHNARCSNWREFDMGASSFLNRNVPPNVLAYGVPITVARALTRDWGQLVL